MYSLNNALAVVLLVSVKPMRLLTLIQLSAAATCPVAMITLHKDGSQPANSLVPPDEGVTAKLLKNIARSPSPTTPVYNVAPEVVPQLAATVTLQRPMPQFSTAKSTAPASTPQLTVQSAPIRDAMNAKVANLRWDRIIPRTLPASLFSDSKLQSSSTRTQTPPPPTIAGFTKITSEKIAPPELPGAVNTFLQSSSLLSSLQPTTDSSTQSANQITAQLPQSGSEPFSAEPPIETPYLLGPGDTIQVNATNAAEFSGQHQIALDGSITLPIVGRVSVARLSVPDAENAIAARLSGELRRPRILVTVLKSRPLRVGIAGEIKQPGLYSLNSDAAQLPSIVQAIQAAGGVTLAANLQQVEIHRRSPGAGQGAKGVQKFVVDLSSVAQTGDLSQNLMLRDGDAIFIPASTTVDLAAVEQLAGSNLAISNQAVNVALVGEVARPGSYKIEGAKDSGARPTVTQAIQQAGGITPDADLRAVQVRRMTRSGKPQIITLNFRELIQNGDLRQDLMLQPGDTIRLAKAPAMSAADLIEQGAANISPTAIRINVLGEVKSPGQIQVGANSTLNQALLAAGGFDRRAKRTVELIRLNPNGTVTRRTIRIDLSRGIDPADNPVLYNNDVIVVDRSGFAKFSDGLSDILNPVFRLLPLQFLF